MNKYHYVAYPLILCIAVCATLCGCTTISIGSQSNAETQPVSETVNVSETTLDEECYSFDTVADLKAALKSDPYKYIDKKVYVKGTLAKCEVDNYSPFSRILALVDISEPLSGYNGVELRSQLKNNPSVNIKISDDIIYTVAEHNDYVLVCGILKISDGEIYLDNCTLLYE